MKHTECQTAFYSIKSIFKDNVNHLKKVRSCSKEIKKGPKQIFHCEKGVLAGREFRPNQAGNSSGNRHRFPSLVGVFNNLRRFLKSDLRMTSRSLLRLRCICYVYCFSIAMGALRFSKFHSVKDSSVIKLC